MTQPTYKPDLSPDDRARLALDGLSVGDAFGEGYFVSPSMVESLIADRYLLRPPWHWTDDTNMACSLVQNLQKYGQIEQNELAQEFAARYDISRSYGPAMHGLLENIRLGVAWQTATRWLFEGQGSWGNGAAMRVAPLGAYFADDLHAAIKNAALSAQITHTHPEAVAGTIAVSVAAALAHQMRNAPDPPTRAAFIDAILPYIPPSIVREKCRHARDLTPDCSVRLAVAALGNGTGISAQDTVPFCLWCAGEKLTNYEEALWLTVSGLGDRDTTCAIVGGIVPLFAGRASIPALWLENREPLPEWFAISRAVCDAGSL